MESYQEELANIKTILKKHPKGMTVTDIAREIHINRNSVAKYLDILLISGHAEMLTFGPAKVFFPSSRIPLTAMLNFTHDYITLLDRDLKFLQISDNLLRFLSIQRTDIIGRPLDTLGLSFFQLPDIITHAKRALNGKEFSIEKRYEHTQGTTHLRIRYIPTTFDDGEPGVTLIIEDITERKQYEETMKRIIQEWETMFHSITDMVFIQDTEYSILKANKSFAEFLHMTPEECIGRKCYHVVHEMHTAHSPCPCSVVQQTKQPATVSFYEPHLGKHLQVSASPIFNDDGEITGSVHIIKDITNQKQTTSSP
ncbi:MAG: PAS domain-containing protein [Candidatus Thermoplasmatota archaeon]|nr:PAS domain-containing protein [Candidatus Thermoplasmatota archaeon]